MILKGPNLKLRPFFPVIPLWRFDFYKFKLIFGKRNGSLLVVFHIHSAELSRGE